MYTSHYMEEVEEICSRIIIIDKGKTIAAGSKEELKAGIMMKEKIEVEQVKLQEQQVQDIQDIANVFSVQYNANVLQVKFTEGKRNLANLLDYFTQENITYGKVYSQQPTLNDVFLEITGKTAAGLRRGEYAAFTEIQVSPDDSKQSTAVLDIDISHAADNLLWNGIEGCLYGGYLSNGSNRCRRAEGFVTA